MIMSKLRQKISVSLSITHNMFSKEIAGILTKIFGHEFITNFQVHHLPEIAWQLYPSSIIYFGERHSKSIVHLCI